MYISIQLRSISYTKLNTQAKIYQCRHQQSEYSAPVERNSGRCGHARRSLTGRRRCRLQCVSWTCGWRCCEPAAEQGACCAANATAWPHTEIWPAVTAPE